MEKFNDIYDDIEVVTKKEVVKKSSISVAAIGMLTIAVLAVAWALNIEDPNSMLSTFLYTLAVILLIVSVIKFLNGRSGYLFIPTGSRVKKMTLYFDNKESQRLLDCMQNKKFDDLLRMKRQVNTGVKVDAMIAGDSKFAAVQVSEYIPYTYEPVSPVICYYGEDASKFVGFFK